MANGDVYLSTTIRVSDETLEKLKQTRRQMQAALNQDLTLSEIVDILVNEYQKGKKGK